MKLGKISGIDIDVLELMAIWNRGPHSRVVGRCLLRRRLNSRLWFSLLQQNSTPPPLAPVSGLLNPLYGQQLGLYQDQVPQKQKKRGKKHRHANTSSGGGGVVDLADPSILQARMHQGGANAAAGQGLYGSQGQGGYNHSNMVYSGGFGRW